MTKRQSLFDRLVHKLSHEDILVLSQSKALGIGGAYWGVCNS
jgi:hypothetical protein